MIEETLKKVARALTNAPKSDEERFSSVITQLNRKYAEMGENELRSTDIMAGRYGADYWSMRVIECMTHAALCDNPQPDYLDAALACIMAAMSGEEEAR